MSAVKKAEFARMKNWDRAYVTRLAKQGRLVLTDDGLVDVEASEAKLDATQDQSKAGVKKRWVAERKQRDVYVHVDPTNAPDLPNSQSTPPSAGLYDFQSARAKRESALAEIATLELAKQRKHLLDRNAVVHALTSFAAIVPARLDQLRDRVCAQVPDDSIRELLYRLLDEEHVRLCDELADEMERGPAGEH